MARCDGLRPRHLPNLVAETFNPYVPVNQPAISDLSDFFEFSKKRNRPTLELINGWN
jgi:hypothetical protein